MMKYNVLDNLEFKGKTLAKFLLRGHLLSIYNNDSKIRAIQKVYHWSHSKSIPLS